MFLLILPIAFIMFYIYNYQDNKVTGRKADVMLAAHQAAEIALRLVKPGNEVCSIKHAKSFIF